MVEGMLQWKQGGRGAGHASVKAGRRKRGGAACSGHVAVDTVSRVCVPRSRPVEFALGETARAM